MTNVVDFSQATKQAVVAPFLSEIELASRFVAKHHNELRYVANWGQWFRFDGKVWREEKTLWAFDAARAICRDAAAEGQKGEAKGIASAKVIAAIERIAKADRQIAATVDQWDCDPWLLNTPAGTVDLKTGKMRPHDANDYITKITTVSPGKKCGCKLWKKHLKKVLVDDEVIRFTQEYFGYALTGDTSEDIWCFAHGGGRNGKDTTMDAVTGILGDYHKVAPIETFTVTRFEQHPTDLAMLRGARLVTVDEVEKGQRWAEAKIKRLTGGSPISARFMRQDFFDYKPQFKLWISGNNKPHFRSVDEATTARVHLIPFEVTIPPKERDPNFPDKLRPEWPGILQWMIDGCLAWQKRPGFDTPEKIRTATKEYLQSESGLQKWIEECCELDPNWWTETAMLFERWRWHRDEINQWVGSLMDFSEKLDAASAELGLEKKLHHETRRSGYRGLKLRPWQSRM
jgi:putative DNA primase/helicase